MINSGYTNNEIFVFYRFYLLLYHKCINIFSNDTTCALLCESVENKGDAGQVRLAETFILIEFRNQILEKGCGVVLVCAKYIISFKLYEFFVNELQCQSKSYVL